MPQGTTPKSTNPLQVLQNSSGGTPGMRARRAVAAKCWECMGGPDRGLSKTTIREIKMCTSPRCPLYSVRPYK